MMFSLQNEYFLCHAYDTEALSTFRVIALDRSFIAFSVILLLINGTLSLKNFFKLSYGTTR